MVTQRLLGICPRVVYLGSMVVAYLVFAAVLRALHADFHNYCINLYSHQDAYLWAHHLGLFSLEDPSLKSTPTMRIEASQGTCSWLSTRANGGTGIAQDSLNKTHGEVGILAKQKPVSDRYHNEQSRCLVSWSWLKDSAFPKDTTKVRDTEPRFCLICTVKNNIPNEKAPVTIVKSAIFSYKIWNSW